MAIVDISAWAMTKIRGEICRGVVIANGKEDDFMRTSRMIHVMGKESNTSLVLEASNLGDTFYF